MIELKMARILSGFDIVDFATCKDWGEETYEFYYRYFDNEDPVLRAGSLLVFTCMVGNWYYRSGDVFRHGTEEGIKYFPEKQFYFLDEYLASFLDVEESVKKHFPILHSHIVYFLYKVDREKPVEQVFPKMDEALFKRMRTRLFNGKNIREGHGGPAEIKELLKELQLPEYFYL